ncbi:RNA polymerase sporulation sigma factor SigK [Brockia lithotrophica]|uniref:RNA polymerase sigma factor n=1 Tax=Brockia lithotrophica TaxID=933949 RepID=A0A660L7W1_9BACL|nr:RNA polymerase sporulation sigma factor SigK [Brockia lithotrophica]RKQ88922.1 RNA polymerase sigma-27/28 (RpsK/SigK) subunit [Brockia lithotrophica]
MDSLLHWFLWVVRELKYLIGQIRQGSFPHPLPEEEEEEYVRRMLAGDVEARNRLIEHNLRLVAHIAKKFETSGEDPDDLISIGTIGLIKAVETYSPDKGTKLATYAAKCVENEILMHLRATKKMRRDISLFEPIGTDKEGNALTLMDVLPREEGDDFEERIAVRIERDRLEAYLHVLDEREREVIVRRFGLTGGEEETQKDVARALGISRSYVSRIEKRALMKLYHAMFRQTPTERPTFGGVGGEGHPSADEGEDKTDG